MVAYLVAKDLESVAESSANAVCKSAAPMLPSTTRHTTLLTLLHFWTRAHLQIKDMYCIFLIYYKKCIKNI